MRRTFYLLLLTMCVVAIRAHASDVSVSAIQTIQKQLKSMGHYGGPIDGIQGSQTNAAIRRYQVAHDLRVTGTLTDATLASLGFAHAPPPKKKTDQLTDWLHNLFESEPSPTTVRHAQEVLRDLGYYKGSLDGIIGPATREATRTFQRVRGITENGNLNRKTLRALDIR